MTTDHSSTNPQAVPQPADHAAWAKVRDLLDKGWQAMLYPPDRADGSFGISLINTNRTLFIDREADSPEAALAAAYTRATGAKDGA